jgi:hypothetical protein
MGAIVIRTRFDEGTESAEAATSAWVRKIGVHVRKPVDHLVTTSARRTCRTQALVAASADSVPSSNLVRITIAPIGTTFGNLVPYMYCIKYTSILFLNIFIVLVKI